MKNYLDVNQIVVLLDAGYKYLGLQEHMRTSDRYEYFAKDCHVFQFKNGSSEQPVWMCALSAWESAIHQVCNGGLAHQVINSK